MSKGILARKVGMTQLFTPQGTSVPVTVLEAGPCRVVQRKTVGVDGYEAVQLGFGDRPRSARPQADRGPFQARRPPAAVPAGGVARSRAMSPWAQELTVDMFAEGQRVDVTGRDARARASPDSTSATTSVAGR